MKRLKKYLILFSFISLPLTATHATDDVPSYQQALDKFTEQSKKSKAGSGYNPHDKAVMDKAEQDLRKKMPNPGLKVNQNAPDFKLKNAFGKDVRLSELLKKGPVILSFYRGAWCPYCNLQLHTLHKSLSVFKQYGAQLVLVTPQKPDKSREQLKKDNYAFEVLSDLDSRVMKQYKLYYELSPDLVSVYKKLGLNLEDFNGQGRNVLPVPGTFIIDKKGKIKAVHADVDYKKRMEPKHIVRVLKRL